MASPLPPLFFAALLTVDPGFPVPSEVQSRALELRDVFAKQLPRNVRQQLDVLAQRWVDTGAEPDLDRWRIGVAHTANRVGLIVCGDLEVAAQMIKTQAAPPGSPSAAEMVDELLGYCVSEQYFEVRRKLGLAVDSEDADSLGFEAAPTQTPPPRPTRAVAATITVMGVALLGALIGLLRC